MTRSPIIENGIRIARLVSRGLNPIGRRLRRSPLVGLICGQICGLLCIAVVPGLLFLGLLGQLDGPLLALMMSLSVTVAAVLGRFSLHSSQDTGPSSLWLTATVWGLNLVTCFWLSVRGAYLYAGVTLVLLLLCPRLLGTGLVGNPESDDTHLVRRNLPSRAMDTMESDISTLEF